MIAVIVTSQWMGAWQSTDGPGSWLTSRQPPKGAAISTTLEHILDRKLLGKLPSVPRLINLGSYEVYSNNPCKSSRRWVPLPDAAPQGAK
jgi:hypothetical protein